MKTRSCSVLVRAVLTVVLPVLFLGAGGAPDETSRLDTGVLATRLVDKCAGIHEGDLVLITGSPRDLRLIEDVAVRVREIGAFPVVSMVTDRMAVRALERTSENFLGRTNPFEMRIAESVNAIIAIDASESIDLLAGVPPAKLDAIARAERPVDETLLKRNVRMVDLGNELYPTTDRARRYGMTLDELSAIFWDGVNVEYQRLRAAADGVRAILAGGKKVHMTKPNGTDVTFNIGNRQVFVSDGVISDEDLQKGGPACHVWLPAGEVYMSVVPGTANGKIVSDQFLYNGTEVRGLTLTLKNGKVTGMSAASGFDAVKQQYAVGGEGKDLLSSMDIGINPAVTVPPGSTMLSWVTSGMVTVSIGNNLWNGGDNASSFNLALHIPGTTTTVDNTLLVDRGRLTAGAPLAEIPLTTTSPQARTHYRAALELADHLRDIEARPHIEQAIAADPTFAMAFWLKSQNAPSFAESEKSIEHALALSAHLSDGERIHILAMRKALDGDQIQQEELLRKLVSLYPEDKRALLFLASFLYTQRKFDESRTTLRKAIALDADFAPAYNLLGYVNMLSGNLTEAERLFKKYVELIPNEPNPHDSYAELLMKMGKYDESIEEYEKAISLDQQFYSSYVGLAYNYAFKGQFPDAQRQLNMLIEKAVDDGVRTMVLDAGIAVALHEGKYDRAVESAEQGYALASKNNDPRLMFRYQTLIGDVTLEANAVDNTKHTYLKSRNAEPARVQKAASHYAEAKNAMTQATLPEETRQAFEQELRAHAVEVAIRGNDLATAKKLTEEYRTNALAKRIAAESEKAHELAGMVAVAENRLQDAVSEFNRANLRDPRNLFRLMEVYEAQGDKVMANDIRQRLAAFNETGVNYAYVRRLTVQ